MPPLKQLIPELTQGGLRRDIVANDGLRLPQRATGRPLAIRRALARREPDLVDVAFLAAMPRDNLAVQCLRIYDADPRHFECPRFDRRSARFPEQRFPVAHAHTESIDPAQHGVHAIQSLDPVLRLHPVGEISNEGTEYPTAAVSYGRNRQLHRKFVPVAVHSRDLYPLVYNRAFAGFEKLPEATCLCLTILVRDDCLDQGLADCLFPGPAKGIFRL